VKTLLPVAARQRLAALWSALCARGLPDLLALAAAGLGVLLLLAGAAFPWFLVPEWSGGAVRGVEPAVSGFFRALVLAAGLAALATPWAPARWRRLAAGLAAALLLAVLLFPTVLLHTAPDWAARAAWQWHQHDQLTGYSGDIYSSQEVRDASWQQRILVAQTPLQNRVLRPPTWSPVTLEWGRFFEIAEWLGLAPWFSQSLAQGWALAVAGSLLLLLVAVRTRALAEPEFARRFARRSTLVAGLVVALAMLPFFVCGHLLTRARSLAQSGRAAESLAFLERAATWVPAIREDGAWLLQVGLLEAGLQRPTPAAALYRARRLEEDGYAQQAQAGQRAALATSAPHSALRRELVKGLLSGAIEALNSGRIAPAIEELDAVLAADPCNLKANYALQIAAVRLGHLETLEALATRLLQTYRLLNTPTKCAVLSATQEHLAFARMQSGTPQGALASWRAAKRPPR